MAVKKPQSVYVPKKVFAGFYDFFNVFPRFGLSGLSEIGHAKYNHTMVREYPQNVYNRLIGDFSAPGKIIQAARNVIKVFETPEGGIAVKSFRKPNLINRVVYRYFRLSKAKRSYLYANKLIALGFQTPQPLFYREEIGFKGLDKSYYGSHYLEDSVMLRDIIGVVDYPERDKILDAYADCVFALHENRVEVLDNTPGNVLVRQENGRYEFYLVDLNRIKFHSGKIGVKRRFKNLAMVTGDTAVMQRLSARYANNLGYNSMAAFTHIRNYRQRLLKQKHYKRMLKKPFKTVLKRF